MHHGKCHIDLSGGDAVTFKAQQTLTPDGRNGSGAIVGVGVPGTGRQHGIVAAAEEDPFAFRGNAHRQNVVLFLVDIVQNRFGRTQRDLVLRADAAEENTYIDLIQIIASFKKEVEK
jgi:hypothetical protein